jgi:hypothetical protein
MDKKSLGFLAGAGGTLLLLYFLFFKKSKSNDNNNTTNPFPESNQPFDPYSLIDKATKIQEIKDYIKTNATDLQKSAYSLGLDPIWTFADNFAKSSDAGINAWYAAIKKNEPKFSFYNSVLLSNQTFDTKTGQKI